MIRHKLKKLAGGRAVREARPLLVSVTMGFSLALVVAAAAAFNTEKSTHPPSAETIGSASADTASE